MILKGTAGDDDLSGTAGSDLFNLRQGGNDSVQGLSGHDLFVFGDSFTAADRVDGGAGSDTVFLSGADYGTPASPFDLGSASLTSVEVLRLGAGNDYDLVSSDANIAAGATLIVNAASLGMGDSLTFDGSAETDGSFRFVGGNASGTLTGGAGRDVFVFEGTRAPSCFGGAGNDVFTFDAAAGLSSGEVDGGSGEDTLILNGDYSESFDLAPANVERFILKGGHSYGSAHFIMVLDDSEMSGARIHVDASESSLMYLELDQIGAAGASVLGGAGNDFLYAYLPLGPVIFDGGGGGNGLTIETASTKVINLSHLKNVQDVTIIGYNAPRVVFSGDTAGSGTLSIQAFGGIIDLTQETSAGYNLTGNGFNDTFIFSDNLHPTDRIDGGLTDEETVNTVKLDDGLGDPSGQPFEFVSGMLVNIDRIQLVCGQDYGLQIDGYTNNNGSRGLSIDARALGADDALRVAGSNLTFEFSGNYSSRFDFSSGSGNTLLLAGDYGANGPLVLGTNLGSVSTLEFANNYLFDIATIDGWIASGATLTVDLPATTSQFRFDGSAETNGSFHFLGYPSGGNFTLTGGHGDDIFEFHAHPTGLFVDGGGGDDTLIVDTTQLTLSNGHARNIGHFVIDGGSLTLEGNPTSEGTADIAIRSSGGVMAGQSSVPIIAHEESAQSSLLFTGSPLDDVVYLQNANPLHEYLSETYETTADLGGGGGYDTLYLDTLVADFTGPNGFIDFQKIVIDAPAGPKANIWLAGTELVSTETMTVDATQSQAPVYFSDPDAGYGIDYTGGGAGTIEVDSGTGNDRIDLSADSLGAIVDVGWGADDVTLDSAGDGTVYVHTQDSSGAYATIHNIAFSVTKFDPFITGVDPALTAGALSTASTAADLASAIGPGELQARHAMLFTPDSGTLAGHMFLIIDANGVAGYQAGQDYVADVTGARGTLTTADFT